MLYAPEGPFFWANKILFTYLLIPAEHHLNHTSLEPEAIHYDTWYHTQELQCTEHHSSHKPYASGTNYLEVWWKQTP